MGDPEGSVVRVHRRIGDIDPGRWDACANPDGSHYNPFVSHAFLGALEDAGTTGERAGWIPQHLTVASSEGVLLAAMPLYAKTHSQGEYVFDHGWADAYRRAGGQYYPKLQGAVPFTPVPGPRLLVRPGERSASLEALLAGAAVTLTERLGCSSLHITFLSRDAWERLAGIGFLQRMDQQFHWQNRGYATFDDFLATLASRKRKAMRKERAEATSGGIEVEHVTGAAISEAHWDTMFEFYMDTGSRKWGRPYLNRKFFSLLGERLADRCLLVMAQRHGRHIAGALHIIGGDCLYGRYWGTREHHPCLHFELCYYQAIDFAIARGLARAEAGAQGDHKLARGYMPVPTYSAHWIADAGLRRAVARFLEAERAEAAVAIDALATLGPYRKPAPVEEHD